MTNKEEIAAGKAVIKGEQRYVNNMQIVLDCADIDKGLFEKSGFTAIAVGNVYAIGKLPANIKILSASTRVLKAEGGAATVTITVTNEEFSVIATISSTTDANAIGNEVFWNTGDFLTVDGYLCLASSAELNLAQISIDLQYVILDKSVANVA